MLSITDRISFKQRQILIHSLLYYHYDTNVISDKEYDSVAYGLVDMIKQHPNEFMESEYYLHFIGFDGTTGFDLIDKLTEEERYRVDNIAHVLMKPYWKN